mmetsp:Transcript_8630/g.28302  ORF Transcript_8630/g.28302 Transcript_8630/m.28302 type:complete len:115 (-) Transcript_8630:5-349(-)
MLRHVLRLRKLHLRAGAAGTPPPPPETRRDDMAYDRRVLTRWGGVVPCSREPPSPPKLGPSAPAVVFEDVGLLKSVPTDVTPWGDAAAGPGEQSPSFAFFCRGLVDAAPLPGGR